MIDCVSLVGKLIEAEDNMNCNMSNVHVTYRDGTTNNLENVYIRGSKIRFFILPDMLKNAPMFKKTGPKTAGASRGKSGILRAQGKYCLFGCIVSGYILGTEKGIFCRSCSRKGPRRHESTAYRNLGWNPAQVG